MTPYAVLNTTAHSVVYDDEGHTVDANARVVTVLDETVMKLVDQGVLLIVEESPTELVPAGLIPDEPLGGSTIDVGPDVTVGDPIPGRKGRRTTTTDSPAEAGTNGEDPA